MAAPAPRQRTKWRQPPTGRSANGRVATIGLSYAAHTQVSAACLAPPALAAMVVDCGGFSNAYRSGIRNGGAFEMKQVTWAYNQACESPVAQSDPVVRAALAQEDLIDWFKAMPWKRGHTPMRHVPEYEDYLYEQWTHGQFDDYWKGLGIYAQGWHERFADVPQVHMSSWYDAYVPTALENYIGLRKHKRGPVRLIMGPWTHGDRCKSWSGDVDFGPQSTIDGNLALNWTDFRLRWFDHKEQAATCTARDSREQCRQVDQHVAGTCDRGCCGDQRSKCHIVGTGNNRVAQLAQDQRVGVIASKPGKFL